MGKLGQKKRDNKRLMMKKTAPIILGIVICAIALIFSFLSIFTAACNHSAGEIPYFFGWSICSSSGEYDPIGKDDAVLINRITPDSDMKVGDVLVFYYEKEAKLYQGEITSIDGSIFNMHVNDSLGPISISNRDIKGVASYSIGHIGYIVSIFEGKYGMVLSIAITVLLVSIIILLVGDYISVKAQRKVVSEILNARERGRALAEEMKVVGEEEDEDNFVMLKESERVPSEKDGSAAPTVLAVAPDPQKLDIDLQPQAISAIETKPVEEVQEIIVNQTPSTSLEEEPIQVVPIGAVPLATATAVPEKEVVHAAAEVSSPSAVLEEIAEVCTSETVVQSGVKPIEEITASEEPPAALEKKETEAESEVEVFHSFIKGDLFKERINMEIYAGDKDAQLLKKLIDMAAGKRGKFNIFTSVSKGEECPLKVWCGWEDMLFVSSIVNEFKKIKAGK